MKREGERYCRGDNDGFEVLLALAVSVMFTLKITIVIRVILMMYISLHLFFLPLKVTIMVVTWLIFDIIYVVEDVGILLIFLPITKS